MKVYIVEALSNSEYDNISWIDKTFDSLEKADQYVDNKLLYEGCLDEECHSYIITEQEVEQYEHSNNNVVW